MVPPLKHTYIDARAESPRPCWSGDSAVTRVKGKDRENRITELAKKVGIAEIRDWDSQNMRKSDRQYTALGEQEPWTTV